MLPERLKQPLTSPDAKESQTQEDAKEDKAMVPSMILLKDGTLIYLYSTPREINLVAHYPVRHIHLAEHTIARPYGDDMHFLEKLKMTEDDNKFEVFIPEPGYRTFCGRRRDPAKDGFIVQTFELRSCELHRVASKKVLSKDLLTDNADHANEQIEFMTKTDQIKKDYGINTMITCHEMLETQQSYILSFRNDHKLYFVDKKSRAVKELDTSAMQKSTLAPL